MVHLLRQSISVLLAIATGTLADAHLVDTAVSSGIIISPSSTPTPWIAPQAKPDEGHQRLPNHAFPHRRPTNPPEIHPTHLKQLTRATSSSTIIGPFHV
ncbi:hypothetical protein B0T25DRAFT_546558 [Lasiosphaeria hispida]|uniref:Secreted protein n=1 Tax=Lasiosphaeria hispida TaxID=260671 RepID=A0AAJ0MBR0_9PEZI|nr:hypothetical protein B0T25DRAFT_546558 [Lasiosphaeria hispida]